MSQSGGAQFTPSNKELHHQRTPLQKAAHAVPMLYTEAFAGSNNKEFIMELYNDAALLETAAPAMYEAIKQVIEHRKREFLDNSIEPYCSLVAALAQAEGRQG